MGVASPPVLLTGQALTGARGRGAGARRADAGGRGGEGRGGAAQGARAQGGAAPAAAPALRPRPVLSGRGDVSLSGQRSGAHCCVCGLLFTCYQPNAFTPAVVVLWSVGQTCQGTMLIMLWHRVHG
jgi:hypothetical protein